ncbi:MAG TPA: homoserine O-acetyltransferase [Acidimicrobiales bacterium]
MIATPLPVTGAWCRGDDPGHRQFVRTATDRPMVLEGGGTLRDVTICFETWGDPACAATDAILVCHALTGDSHAAGEMSLPAHPTEGWWKGLIGPGRALDTDRYLIVCVNVLGGCQGSTGPASLDPGTGKPYGSSFPQVSIRDMVRCQSVVADHLGVERWRTVIGGSMGGMQVLEWGVTYPDRIASLVPIATTAQATAQQIGWGSVGRQAIRLDPGWNDGDYYDLEPGAGPHAGLSIARQAAQITYRSDNVFSDRFGRQPVEPLDGFDLWDRFEVERYLHYHGAKLVRRFDANSYLRISKAMDLHDIGRGRGSVTAALTRISVPVLTMGISSDALYWPEQQRQLARQLAEVGVPSTYAEIDSPHGHDAFLIDLDQIHTALVPFLDGVGSPRSPRSLPEDQ